MNLRPEEISSVIKEQIEKYSKKEGFDIEKVREHRIKKKNNRHLLQQRLF